MNQLVPLPAPALDPLLETLRRTASRTRQFRTGRHIRHHLPKDWYHMGRLIDACAHAGIPHDRIRRML